MINLEWYRTFVAIYQQGNMTKAAQELSISQPNVSVHLASLEQYVGGKLFERMPRKMVATEMGRQLYTQIIGSIEHLTSAELFFTRKTLGNRSVIRIGTPSEFFYSRVTPNLSTSTSELVVSFGMAKELTQQLIDGSLDFVIASQKTTENKQIVYEPILTENFILIGSKELDLKDFKNSIKNEDYERAEQWLLEQNWYAYSADLAFIRRFWQKNFNKRPVLIPKYIIPNLNAIIKSIALGNGVSVVSDFLAEEFINENKIVSIWSGKEVASNTIYLAFDKSKMTAEKVEEIKEVLKG